MAGSDLYSALIGAPVDSAEKQAALADLLRRKSAFASVAQLSGDPTLAPMGQAQSEQAGQQANQLRQGAQNQQQALFQKTQEARIAAAQQQQLGQGEEQLALTRRGQDLDYLAAQERAAAAANKPAAQPTEGERKAATLAVRLEGAMRELQTLGTKASKPGVLERSLEAVGMESGANVVRSSDRQRANTAQLDALDAALTLATGASYTKEQLANLRSSYFPQIGDDPATVKAKAERFETVVKTAKIAAGRAGGAVDEALGEKPTKRRKFNPATGKIE